jgi:hypothetical protein
VKPREPGANPFGSEPRRRLGSRRSALKLRKALLLIFVVVDVAGALVFLPFRDSFLQFESSV